MKKLVNQFRQLDMTKRIVILFITISFVFIFGIGIYNSSFENKKNVDNEIVNVDENDDLENKENNLSSDLETTNDKQEEIDEQSNLDENQEENQKETTNQQSKKSSDDTSQQNNQTSSQKKNEKVSKKDSQSNDKQSQQETTQVNKKQSENKEEQKTQEKEVIENTKTETVENKDKNKVNQEENISITIKVTGIDETMMSGQLQVEKGTNVYGALVKLASQKGKSVSGSSSYVTGIGGLNEKDYGPLSGWMYKVNNVVPNRSAGSYVLEEGDTVVWFYVNYK